MITTIIPNFSVIPQRSDPSNFSVFRDIWLTEEQLRITLTNDVADEMNTVSAEVNNNAQTAIDKAAEASISATSSAASANNRGAWGALTGTFPIGEAVNHNGSTWISNIAITDITTSEPTGVNTDWTEISGERVLKTAEVIQWEEDNAQFLTWTGGAYTDLGAIGANPSAKIYPDGTIIGSTDNGNYTKWSSGKLECRGIFTETSVAITSPTAGGGYAKGGQRVDLPSSYTNSVFTVIVGPNGNSPLAVNSAQASNTINSFIPNWRSAESLTINCAGQYVTKGRWK